MGVRACMRWRGKAHRGLLLVVAEQLPRDSASRGHDHDARIPFLAVRRCRKPQGGQNESEVGREMQKRTLRQDVIADAQVQSMREPHAHADGRMKTRAREKRGQEAGGEERRRRRARTWDVHGLEAA
eukprot:2154010-Rhodomonas_salina.1